MPSTELPRALEHYFAHAETGRTRAGRRYSITLSYLSEGRLDRLQWWWHASPADEQGGEAALAAVRAKAVERFLRHIDRWLENTGQRFFGEGPFPCIGPKERAVAMNADRPDLLSTGT